MEPFEQDRRFVARLLAGDEQAYDELFEVHAQRLYRFALARVGGDEELARELVQATLAKAFPQLARFRGEASLLTWLCAICRFELSARSRRRQRAPVEVELVDDSPEVRTALELLGSAEAARSPEQRVLRKEVSSLVQAVLDHLPHRYGDVLEWKYVDGLTVERIGERLAIGRTAAQSLLARARRAFRAGFAEVAQAAGGASLVPGRRPEEA